MTQRYGVGIARASTMPRGAGSAPARAQVASPLVVIADLDKAAETTTTTRGNLPDLAETLKVPVEPGAARASTCRFFQMPFDLSRVMTANSLARLPTPQIGRCRVVRIPDPNSEKATPTPGGTRS